MTILGIHITIWAIVFVSTLVRLNSRPPRFDSNMRNSFSYLSTFIISMIAGLFLHQPLSEFIGIASDKAILIAALLALSAENIMTRISRYTETVSIKDIIQLWLNGKGKK